MGRGNWSLKGSKKKKHKPDFPLGNDHCSISVKEGEKISVPWAALVEV